MQIVQNLLDAKKVRGVISVPKDALIINALRKFEEHKISAVLVMDGDMPIGIFTKTDYALKGEVAGRSAMAHITEVMSIDLKKVRPGADMFNCVQVMHEDTISHLVVVDGPEYSERVVGIVSVKDILRALAEDMGRIWFDQFGSTLIRS